MLTCILVFDQVDVHDLTILREDGQKVSLREVIRESAGEDVGRVLKLCVPRRRVADALCYLPLRRLLRVLDLREWIHINSLPN